MEKKRNRNRQIWNGNQQIWDGKHLKKCLVPKVQGPYAHPAILAAIKDKLKLVGPVTVRHNPPVPAMHDTALEKNWESKGDPKEPHAPPCIWLSGPGFQNLDKRTLGFSTSTDARTRQAKLYI